MFRALQKRKDEKATWLCSGNMFIKYTSDEAKRIMEKGTALKYMSNILKHLTKYFEYCPLTNLP